MSGNTCLRTPIATDGACLSIAWRDPVTVAIEVRNGRAASHSAPTRAVSYARCGECIGRRQPAHTLGIGIPKCPCAACMKNPENSRRK